MVDTPAATKSEVNERPTAPKTGGGIGERIANTNELPQIFGDPAGAGGIQKSATPVETGSVKQGQQSAFSPTSKELQRGAHFLNFDDLDPFASAQAQSEMASGKKPPHRSLSYAEAQSEFEKLPGHLVDKVAMQQGDKTNPQIKVTETQKQAIKDVATLIDTKIKDLYKQCEKARGGRFEPDPSGVDFTQMVARHTEKVRKTFLDIAGANPDIKPKELYSQIKELISNELQSRNSSMHLVVGTPKSGGDAKLVVRDSSLSSLKRVMGSLPNDVAELKAQAREQEQRDKERREEPDPIRRTALELLDVIKNADYDRNGHIDKAAKEELVHAFRTSPHARALAAELNLVGAPKKISVSYHNDINFPGFSSPLFSYNRQIPEGSPLSVSKDEIKSIAHTVPELLKTAGKPDPNLQNEVKSMNKAFAKTGNPEELARRVNTLLPGEEFEKTVYFLNQPYLKMGPPDSSQRMSYTNVLYLRTPNIRQVIGLSK